MTEQRIKLGRIRTQMYMKEDSTFKALKYNQGTSDVKMGVSAKTSNWNSEN